jgi:hypothetical protein
LQLRLWPGVCAVANGDRNAELSNANKSPCNRRSTALKSRKKSHKRCRLATTTTLAAKAVARRMRCGQAHSACKRRVRLHPSLRVACGQSLSVLFKSSATVAPQISPQWSNISAMVKYLRTGQISPHWSNSSSLSAMIRCLNVWITVEFLHKDRFTP